MAQLRLQYFCEDFTRESEGAETLLGVVKILDIRNEMFQHYSGKLHYNVSTSEIEGAFALLRYSRYRNVLHLLFKQYTSIIKYI